METDGKTNIRYILADMTHVDYGDMITAFITIHIDKNLDQNPDKVTDEDTVLTILPNTAETQAIVKVVGHVGWLNDEDTRMTDGLSSGLFLNIYTYDDLPSVHAIISSRDWPSQED